MKTIKQQEARVILDMERRLNAATALVSEQAEDEGLWFEPETAPEDYLQRALRKLHAVVEDD